MFDVLLAKPGARARSTLPAVLLALAALLALGACGDDAASTCAIEPFPAGDPVGHPQPLAAGATGARAGRVTAADLPATPGGLLTWREGDFVLANERVALVIEDAGPSDLYDPWGGRPVGVARVEGGRLVEPANFGEFFLLTGRSTIVTDSVSVIADGRDGGPAIVRARGTLHPLPFFEALVSSVFSDELLGIEAAIDYELAPGADHVDVRFRFRSPRPEATDVRATMHALMYTARTPAFQPDRGFDDALAAAPYVVLVDDAATSWAYIPGEGVLGSSLSASGFLGAFGPGVVLPGCGETERVHARLAIGASLDGAVVAAEGVLGRPLRAITGTVTRAGAALADAHVHAVSGARYLGRARTDAQGAFTVHVPADADVTLEVFRRGDALGTTAVGTGAGPAAIDLPDTGSVRVTVTDGDQAVPARIQLLPAPGTALPTAPANYGEAPVPGGRLHVAYEVDGDATLTVPPGTWEVIASRGYEYELARQTVTVTAGTTLEVPLVLEHVVDTTGVQCADFHIHTARSNDSGDDAHEKVRSAIADGLELPVRSDHEYVADFAQEIVDVGGQAYAAGFGSIELTSFELWGHMGVFPLVPDPTRVNAGAPAWQTFPTPEAPDTPFATRSPVEVFDQVRARPEAPVVIINHPRGPTNYFGYVGYDAATGTAEVTAEWDTAFTLVEVFNDASWTGARDGIVEDWLGLLRAGRKVMAVGSSDSHGLAGSPVGYPRTCIALGTDDPRQLTAAQVRDQLAAGHATVSGGIYVDARLGAAGPGDTTTGAGAPQQLAITVQAASWVDVDAIDVVVDGQTVDTIPVLPGDADPANPAIRWSGTVPVTVRAAGGFVLVAAHGDGSLAPVHPGRTPFGVTNPIFVAP